MTRLLDADLPSGRPFVRWDAADFTSVVNLYRIVAGEIYGRPARSLLK